MEEIEIGGADGARLIFEWLRGEFDFTRIRKPTHEEKLDMVAVLLQGVLRVCEDAGLEVALVSAFDTLRGDTPTGMVGIQFVVADKDAFEPVQCGGVLAPVYPDISQPEVLSGTLKILSVPVTESVTLPS